MFRSMLVYEYFLPCIFPEHILCFISAQITVAFMCFHVPTDTFMSCTRSSTHKLLGLYPHQLCETISFSSSVMNIFKLLVLYQLHHSDHDSSSWDVPLSLGQQILLFCHTAFMLSVKQSKNAVWL